VERVGGADTVGARREGSGEQARGSSAYGDGGAVWRARRARFDLP
jgi:hypothetical protein